MDKYKNLKDKQNSLTIKDLCPQQKQKIGELVRRLAQQTALKNQYKQKYQQIQKKYDQLINKYDQEVTKQHQQNRILKMQYKNSCKILQKTYQSLKKRRSCQKKYNVQSQITNKKQESSSNMDVSKQNDSKYINQQSNYQPRTSKKSEISQLKQQISKLANDIKTTTNQKLEDPNFQQKLRQYQLIKTRYNTNIIYPNQQTLVLDTTFKQDKTFQSSSFIEPKMLIRDSYKIINQSNYDTKKNYETVDQSIYRKVDDTYIGTPIKKVIKQKSCLYKDSFYDCDLLDLVEELQK